MNSFLTIIFLIFLGFSFVLPYAPCEGGVTNSRLPVLEGGEIAAVVNEEIISLLDVKNRVKFFAITTGQPYSSELYARVSSQVLETLINESLQRQQAKTYKIKLGGAEIKDGISRLEKMNGKDDGFLAKLCKDFQIPYETLEKQVEANLVWEVVSRELFRASLQVSKNEVDTYIKRLESNQNKPHVHLAEIFIAVDNPSQEPAAQRKIREILRHVHQGTPFPLLAQQFSDSPTKARGGDIGWSPEDELESSLKKSLKSLKGVKISPPLRTNDGYKIFYLLDRKDTSPEMAAQVLYTYKRVNFPLAVNAEEYQVFQAAQKAISVSEAAKSCEMFENLAKASGNVQTKEVGGVLEEDIPPPVLEILGTLAPCKEGETSQKCRSSKPVRSEIGILLFMLCKRETLKAGLMDRQQIQGRLSQMKLQNLMGRELRNLRRAAHVVNKFESGASFIVANRGS